eukprot:TRINITY_DN19193_c0_g1_i1.p1 TRINITY_DN19193_c0_g1~~TRINITY_DN19193_c0_g1_i1.p1  ORF type:complete len:160 (-),score=53.81 TRINITY_DN19193_c0_g1_i1:156-635(-)
MWWSFVFFFFSSRRRHTRCREVSWARRCVQETDQRRVHGNRLNGMAEIKKLVESVDQTSVHNYIYQATEGWMNSDYMAKWLVENKVLDQVLNDNTHPELVRRTAPIFIFLSKKEVLTNEMLELLWKCQIDKHEDLVRVVYQTIQEITEFLPIDLSLIHI